MRQQTTYNKSCFGTGDDLFPVKWLMFVILLFIFSVSSFSQVAGDYRSNGNVNFTSASNWEIYNGSTWIAASAAPTDSDGEVTISTGDVASVTADHSITALEVYGIINFADNITFTIYGDVHIYAGAELNMPGGNGESTLVVYGNYTNEGTSDFNKSTVIVAGNFHSSAASEVQNNGTLVVGGDATGELDISGSGDDQFYPINPNANIDITPTSISNNDYTDLLDRLPPGIIDIVDETVFGGSCGFTIDGPSNVSACEGSSASFEITSTTATSPTYSWEVDDGSGWSSAGSTSSILTVSGLTSAMDGYSYRCEVTEDGSCSKYSYTATLTVSADNTAPVPDVAALSTITGECSATITVSPTATDDCAGSITGTTSDPLTYNTQGSYIVTWTYDDGNGNTSTQTQSVVVDDVTNPVISACPADITITANEEYCGNTATWTTPTATDNCSVTLGSSHIPGDFFNVGTTTVTYTATDPGGNTDVCTFDVIVNQVAAPVITGDTDVCTPVTLNYSTPLVSGKTYQWSVTEGTISGSPTNNNADIVWTGTTNGTVTVEVTSGSACTITNTININKNATPLTGDIQSDSKLTRR